MFSRRRFLAALAASAAVQAASPGAPLGLYVDRFEKDLAGQFRNVAAQGYREIEIEGLRDRRPEDLRKALEQAGLSCKSVCWSMWENDADSQDTIDAAVELGVEYLVTPAPLRMGKEWFEPVSRPMTLNDWRWVADWFNHVGGLAQKNNIQFVYRVTTTTGFDELWNRTEPTRVKFELACDSKEFLSRYSTRTVLAHVKRKEDWPLTEPNQIRYAYLVRSN